MVRLRSRDWVMMAGPELLHFLRARGLPDTLLPALPGDTFLLRPGEGEELGRGGGSEDSAASYSSFQDTDSDFSTISNTRGEFGPSVGAEVSSNML